MRLSRLMARSLTLGVVLLSGTIAHADFVFLYSTAGTGFPAAGGGPTYIQVGSPGLAVLNYTPPPTAEVVSADSGSNFSLGAIDTNLSALTGIATFSSVAFDLTVVDLSNPNPATNSVTFDGTISGNLSTGSSTTNLTFATTSATLDGFKISLTPGTYAIVPQTAGGTTTIQAFVSAVPEPSTMALLGMGGASFVGLTFRRRLAKEPVA